MNYLITLGILIIAVLIVSEKSKFALHMIQLEEYKTENYREWVKNNKERAYNLGKDTQPIKSPLVFTDRAKRLYMTNLALSGIIILLTSIPYLILNQYGYILIPIIVVFVVYRQQADIMAYSNIIIRPVEERINMGFYLEAQEKVKSREDLKVVGITGSFGKTSTKFILGTILEEKYNVLNTPESYNTTMGLSKVINSELSDEHEVFIAEMGARTQGEIKEAAELCQPEIGVITSVGPVHIETFGNVDTIAKTKYELIEELPADGVAIFNYDNEDIKKLADKTFKEKRLYGLKDIENVDLYAENIVVSELGSSFVLKDKEGNRVDCTTKLLGEHNIYNILAGASVAKTLGLTFQEISQGISKIEPIPHRLNIIDSGSGLIVIDDAFSSNPVGTKAALKVINQFKEGRKIIVTPGMIELGDMEEEANKEFGNDIAEVCDYAILVGEKRTKPIYQGLIEANYDESNIFVVNTLEEASDQIGKIARPRDVVLFENDLPDNYTE